MKNKYFNWKYGVVVLLSAIVCACSENSDLAQIANKHEQQSGTRTAELKTKTLELETIGTLETKLTEAMGEEDVNTLEKLIVSGPFSAKDLNYLRSLSGLVSLDMENVEIKESDDYYWDGYWDEYYTDGRVYLKEDTICQSMFRDMAFKEIILPSTTLCIDRKAFVNCSNLSSIVIPDGVKRIGDSVFNGCISLSKVVLPQNIEEIGNDTFNNCDSLRTITIPDNVKYIGHNAFYSCDLLSSVEFSTSSDLDSIAGYAFYNSNLKSITIPDKVRKIGSCAFQECDSLVTVILPEMLEEINESLFSGCRQLKSVVIKEKVKNIASWAFAQCKFTSIEFPLSSELDSIGDYVFYDSNLKSIVIPEKVRTIGGNAFSYCDSLATVTLSSNLEYLGEEAFQHCYSLTSIDIPDKVKQIGVRTFYRCNSLESIKLPENLESIGSYAITSTQIESIEFPSTLKTISHNAFQYNYHLTKVVIPEGVETIGTNVFRYNNQLKELSLPSTLTSVETNFAEGCHSLLYLIWNASIDVPYNYGTENCLLYIETDQEIVADDRWNNVIKNGVAQSTITIEARNDEFTCYKEFTAPEVVYTRYFGDETVPGGSSGWQTIVLPFTPDSIGHESKGEIAPFNSDKETVKHFWLRELTADGFVDATTIEPDKPYIIAMPNHSEYLDEYCLNGTITFSAKNVTISKTADSYEPSVGPDFDFHPTYQYKKKALYMYTLHSKWGNYNNMWYNKNFFARSANDVAAFNAYVTAPGGGRSSRSTYDIDTRSKESRAKYSPNNTGIPQIGDM